MSRRLTRKEAKREYDNRPQTGVSGGLTFNEWLAIYAITLDDGYSENSRNNDTYSPSTGSYDSYSSSCSSSSSCD